MAEQKQKGVTLFLDCRMQNQGIKTFNDVDLTQTVNDFCDIITSREGVLGIGWIRTSNGKVITQSAKGHLTLNDFGFYDEMTLVVSLRLKGGSLAKIGNIFSKLGAETSNKVNKLSNLLKKMNVSKECESEFDAARVKQFGGTVVTKDCMIGCSVTCFDKTKGKCKLPCGCVYCPGCMDLCIVKEIKQQCQAQIKCSICKSTVDSVLAYFVAAYTSKKKAETDKILFKNGLKLPKSLLSECSNRFCKQIVKEQPLNGNKLICVSCQQATCHICKSKWINSDSNNKTFCGNGLCDPSIIYKTYLDHAKKKEINGITVTDTRICPGCFGINLHEVACKHITCPCKYQYCHICLQPWQGHNEEKCEVVDKQEITKEMILKVKM